MYYMGIIEISTYTNHLTNLMKWEFYFFQQTWCMFNEVLSIKCRKGCMSCPEFLYSSTYFFSSTTDFLLFPHSSLISLQLPIELATFRLFLLLTTELPMEFAISRIFGTTNFFLSLLPLTSNSSFLSTSVRIVFITGEYYQIIHPRFHLSGICTILIFNKIKTNLNERNIN